MDATIYQKTEELEEKLDMEVRVYQKIEELEGKLDIVHRSYCAANEASKIKDLWEEVRAIETEIDHLYDSIEVH